MSISSGSFKVHSELEAVLQLPFLSLSPFKSGDSTFHLVKNPKYDRRCQKLFRLRINILVMFLLLKSASLVFLLSRNFDSGTGINGKLMMSVGLHLGVSLATLLYFSTEYNLASKESLDELILILNERCKLIPVDNQSNKMLEKIFCWFMKTFACFPIFGLVLPVVEPRFEIFYPAEISDSKVKVWLQIISSLIYSGTAAYATARVAFQFLLQFIFAEGMDILTRRVYGKRETSHNLEFQHCFRQFLVARIMLTIDCVITATYLLLLIILGTLLGAVGMYVTLKGLNSLPTFMLIPPATIFGIATVSNFVLIHLYGEQNRNGIEFVQFWKRRLRRKVERKQLGSCPKIGYRVGPFRNVREELAVTNFAIMVDNTVQLMLILK